MYYDNLTLLTDLYELTMMQGYFKSGATEKVVSTRSTGRIRAMAHMRLHAVWSR